MFDINSCELTLNFDLNSCQITPNFNFDLSSCPEITSYSQSQFLPTYAQVK